MITVVIGGSASGVGKTTLACGLIRALPEFGWVAIKISRHAHGAPGQLIEETESGQGSDTARYLAAGAKRALLLTAVGTAVPMSALDAACDGCTHAVIESNLILEASTPNICLAVVGDGEAKPSFTRVLQRADAVVVRRREVLETSPAPSSARVFCMDDLGCLPPEFIGWLRERIGSVSARSKTALS